MEIKELPAKWQRVFEKRAVDNQVTAKLSRADAVAEARRFVTEAMRRAEATKEAAKSQGTLF